MPEFRHIYVHVPFCEVICHYCHFYTARSAGADQNAFFSALRRELARARSELMSPLEAVYFGGGTPGASPPELLAGLLSDLSVSPGTEVTLEVNPTAVTREKVAAWKNAGVNRVSLGVQSLDEGTLKQLGRVHSAREAREALSLIAAEIPLVSCDLIYAVPNQPEDTPAEHALELMRLGASHLSLYHLTLEKEHFLHPRLPADDFAWRQLRRVADVLEPLGFRHYEVASFAMPGCESRNNRNYWAGGPYYALGPSAHGFDGIRSRWTHVSDWREYVRRSAEAESTRAWTETLDDGQLRIETIFTRLRTAEGLDLDSFRIRFGEELRESRKELIGRLIGEGLASLKENHLALSFNGRMLADEIVRALL